MIIVKDLTVKNFMSVGNQTQAVDFSNRQLTLVLGENLDQGGDDSGSRNGTGKTAAVRNNDCIISTKVKFTRKGKATICIEIDLC